MPSTHPEASPVTLVAGELMSGAGEYCGITVRETAGAVATVTLYDNASAGSGTVLEEVSLAARGDKELFYPRPGRLVQNGIFAVITGTVEGSIFV